MRMLGSRRWWGEKWMTDEGMGWMGWMWEEEEEEDEKRGRVCCVVGGGMDGRQGGR
jgi:hypothetical protein